MSYSKRLTATVAIAISALAIPAGAAHAGQLDSYTYPSGETKIFYIAAPGETNNVTASQTPGAFALTDSGSAGPLTQDFGTPCTLAGNSATCTGTDLGITLGDGNDTAAFTSTVVLSLNSVFFERVSIEGGAGDDTLSASAPANPDVDPITQTPTRAVALFGESFPGAAPISIPPGYTEDVPGNDTLTGGAENDAIYGGPGDDIMNAGDGYDQIDNVIPFVFSQTGRLSNAALGSDTASGGPGYDVIRGQEPTGAEAPDKVSCGTGGEEKGNGHRDIVNLGVTDTVAADCETIFTDVLCPATATTCSGTVQILASAPAAGSASAARSSKRKSKKVVLGKAKFAATRGQTGKAVIVLLRKKVRQVLRKRKSVPASQNVKGKGVGKQRSRFTLNRG